MSDRDQANQDPTVARVQRAEHEGQFARSRELATAITWLAGVTILATFGFSIWTSLSEIGKRSWSETEISASPTGELIGIVHASSQLFWTGILPILGGTALVSGLVWWAQSGFRFFPHLVAPDPTRLSPTRNLSQIFRRENAFTMLLGLGKLIGLMIVAIWVLIGDWTTILKMGTGPLAGESQVLTDWLISMLQRLCLASVVVGLLDYACRRHWHLQSLQMTDQEVRDEQRAMEASPEVASRRRLSRSH